METEAPCLGEQCGTGVPALFGMHDFAEASARSVKRMKACTTIASRADLCQVTKRTARGLTFPPGPRSRLFCIGNMNRKLKSRVRTNYHSILCGSFQGRALMLSLARTTGKVNATDGCSSSCLSHSLWSVGAASRMLPKSPAPVLLPPYISRGVKETNWR